MDMKVAFLVVFGVAAFVALGDKLIDKDAASGKDPLRRSIEKNLKEQKAKAEGTLGSTFGGGAQAAKGLAKPTVKTVASPVPLPSATDMQGGYAGGGGGAGYAPAPMVPANPDAPQRAQGMTGTLLGGNNSYYKSGAVAPVPPTGPGSPAAAYTPMPALTGAGVASKTQEGPALYLKSGQRVLFYDQRIFTMGEGGQLQPLPDGRYELQNGQVMVLRGGKRQVGEE